MNWSKTLSAVALCLTLLSAPTHLARQANSAAAAPLEKNAAAGKYEAKVEELLTAAQDEARPTAEQANFDAVKSWLANNAVPLRAVEAGNGLGDMQPLKKMVGNARLVTLGEATHGTREFFQLKHRMLEFLVSEMGFTVFGIEATMPEGFDINEYVLTGKGDPARALGGLYFWTWDTEEVLAMIKWMRQYNADPQHAKKVKFYGFDMQSAPRAAKVTLAYLRRVDPEQATAAERALALVANPLTDQSYANVPAEKKAAAQAMIEAALKRFDESQAEWVSKTSANEWAVARQHARVLAQNLAMRQGAGVTPESFNVRDRSMAENIRWILDHEGPGTKMVAWAHNGHVGTQSEQGIESMGVHLRRMFGAEMVIFGFAFNQGGFQAMEMPFATGKGLRPFNVGSAPTGSLDATLAAAGLQLAAIDLHALPKEGAVAKWFAEPQQTRSIGASYGEQMAANFLDDQVTPQLYDALLFVEKTSAARPNDKTETRGAAVRLTALTNPGFEDGEAGKVPAGWMASPAMLKFGFEATASDERPQSGQRSALISRLNEKYYGETFGSLTQGINAAAYRGQRLKLRVMARAETTGLGNQAYLRLVIAGLGRVAFDNLINCPVTTADWRAYEIEADVPDNATAISYGLYLIGQGRAWFDTVSLAAVAKSNTGAAADLSGTWKFEVNFEDGRKGTPTFTFKQQGEQLTGAYKGGLGEAPVTGTVKGDEVTFAFKTKVEMEEREINVTFTGQVESAKAMKGTVKATALLPPGKWTATKP